MTLLIIKDGVEVTGASAPAGVAAVTSTGSSQLSNAVPITLVGGGKNNTTLVAANTGGKWAMYQLEAVWSDSADTYTLKFHDTTPASTNPATLSTTGIDIVISANSVPYYLPTPIIVYCANANLALQVDVSGGAGVEELVLFGKYWYEGV